MQGLTPRPGGSCRAICFQAFNLRNRGRRPRESRASRIAPACGRASAGSRERAGRNGGDGSRLLGTIVINGCDLHLEALAVSRDGDMQIWSTDAGELSALHDAVGAGGPWQTVTINGREYVLIATPYCE